MRTRFLIGSIFVFVCFFASAAGEASAQTIDFTILQFPPSFTTAGGQRVDYVWGQIYEAGVTEAAGASPTVTAQFGYGPVGTDPRTAPGWVWSTATYNVQSGNNDEYVAAFTLPTHTVTTQYRYTFRFSVNGGSVWTYADLDGNGTNPGLSFSTAQLGTMTVNPGVLPPTAAPVGIAGRVLNRQGRGIARAFVTFTDEKGIARQAVTSSFGYYRMEGLEAGSSYVMTVRAKRYAFDAKFLSPMESVSGFDLIAK